MKINVNGEERDLGAVDGGTPLLWVLRDQLNLTGTKYGCGRAQCGACTVHVNGEAVRSCSLAVRDAAGKQIVTIEAVSGRIADAVRAAWQRLDVAQCGYCQSGQIMTAISAAREQQEADGRRHRRRHGRQHLPLRHLHPHPQGYPRGCQSAGLRATITHATHPRMPSRPPLRGADFCRRQAPSAAALVLGVHVPFAPRARAAAGSAGPLIFDPNVFLRIGADDTVTVMSKHFEMGQGITTGLATLVAEELEADWAQMRFTFSPYNPKLYNNLAFGPYMVTGGSTSLANSWEQMRKVGAAARTMLVGPPRRSWGVPAEEITVAKGVVSHRASQRSARFGELAAGRHAARSARPTSR